MSCAKLATYKIEMEECPGLRESRTQCVNGVTLHYEVCGEGQPFILLHGNGEDLSIYDDLTRKLSANYKVYAVDTRGHGGSSSVSEFHYADMVEDIHEFILDLKLHRPLLYGFSDGGIVGLMLACKYPDSLDRLMVSGANLNPHGLKGYFSFVCKVALAFTKKTKRGKLELMLQEPNIKENDLEVISVPTLVLAGRRDIVKEKHTAYIANHIENSTLKIVEGTHSSYVKDCESIYRLLLDWINM